MKKLRCWPVMTTALLLMVTQVSAVEIACEYDSNAEWPDPAGKVCQADEPPIGAALFADDAPTSGYPICSSARFDSDGDGWGWENEASCKVQIVSGYPACEDSSSDSDGDGWGWENGASCKVSSAPRKTSYPSCEYRASDDNADGWGYENGASCQITAFSKYPECSSNIEDLDGDGWGYERGSSCQFVKRKTFVGVIFQQDFESTPLGSYGADQVNLDWDRPLWHLGFVQGRVDVVTDAERGNALRVTYPANKYGAAGAAAFLSDVEFSLDLPKSYEELYVSYDVKFAEGFDFVRGGKLPGLCGYDNTLTATSGCNTGGWFPDGYDGWSARGMWREDGKLENYVYHAGQTNYYGDDEYWGANAEPGQWHRIQHRVVLNTPGVANGILEAWLDGKKVLSEEKFLFRKTADIGVNLFYFSTFYGGNDASWAPSEDQHVFFDNFRIATNSEVAGVFNDPVVSENPVIGAALPLNDEAGAAQVKSSGGGATTLLMVLLLSVLRLTGVFANWPNWLCTTRT